MLRLTKLEDRQVREDQPFENLRSRAEKADWTILGALNRVFPWFEDGEDERGFPDRRDICRRDRDVEEGGEVIKGERPHVLEMEDRDSIGSNRSGVFRTLDCRSNVNWSERFEVRI